MIVEGESVGRIENQALAWALIEIYLGKDSKTLKVKRKFTHGVTKYLQQICQ